MASAQQIQIELNSKAAQLQRLNTKVERLRDKHDHHADTLVKIQLDYEIKEAETEILEIDREIQELEEQLLNENSRLQIAGISFLGERIFVTCDRAGQESDFKIFFSDYVQQNPGVPQVYIIPGDERQSHSSLIERFHATSIKEYVKELPLYGEKKAAVPLWEIDLTSRDDLIESEKELLFSLFEKCKPGYSIRNSDRSPAAFRSLLKVSLYPAVVIQHNINIASWSKATKRLLQSYLQFLEKMQGDQSTPQMIIFLNIIYPTPTRWLSFPTFLRRGYKGTLRQRYERELQNIFQLQRRSSSTRWTRDVPIPCVLLDNLRCVTRDDVIKWFRWHNIGGGRLDWNECTDSIIKKNECKSMVEIEGALIKILNQLRAEREKEEKKKGWFENHGGPRRQSSIRR